MEEEQYPENQTPILRGQIKIKLLSSTSLEQTMRSFILSVRQMYLSGSNKQT